MKKVYLFILAVILCLVCAGCGERSNVAERDPAPRQSSTGRYTQKSDTLGGYTREDDAWDEGTLKDEDYELNEYANEESGSQGRAAAPSAPQEVRTLECTLCHGDGVCYHCDGEAFRGGRRCSVCSGTGNCSHCGGAGNMEIIEVDGQDYTLCGSCHGSGECGVCDGIGKKTYSFSTLGTSTSNCSLCHGSGNCLGCKGEGLCPVKGF